MNVVQPYSRPLSLLGWRWRCMNITTGTVWEPPAARDDVRYSGRPTELCTMVWRAQACLHIYGMNDNFMWTIWDRYKLIYDSLSPTAMIRRVEVTIYAQKWSILHPCRLSATVTTHAASKAATIITDRLNLHSCSQGIGRTWVLVHFNIHSEYDQILGYLQVRYTDALADGNGDDKGNGNGNGNGDDEQRVEATCIAAESEWCT